MSTDMSVDRVTGLISLACCLISLISVPLVAQGPCAWSPLGTGTSGSFPGVFALTVLDDGTGPTLYAGGLFGIAGGVPASRVAAWNGVSWSSVGTGVNGPVFALAVFDDGTGPALYAGGQFSLAGGVSANGIAKWDGVSWSALGGGVGGAPYADVSALTVFDDGSGPALYAGGRFTTAGGSPANRVAKWDGSTWSPLGNGVVGVGSFSVFALSVFDDGGGPALYAGGDFLVPGSNVARWDGSSWSPLGWGVNQSVMTLAVFDDGAGPDLYAAGSFNYAGGALLANYVARWDGASWSALGSGLNSPWIYALQTFDDGSGPALYAGGYFTMAGGIPAARIAVWDGAAWSPVGGGVGGGYSGVLDLTVFDDGTGPALYAGGTFSAAGGTSANNIARWDCGSTISVSATHASPGAPVFVNNANLTPGNEYYNLFAVACPTSPGTCGGPFGANWTTQNVNLVLWQMTRPVGTEPFHVVAPSSYVNWGPYNLPPITLDAICIDFTGGSIGATSPTVRITVQ